jgi:penicillin-binding protein 1B
LHLEQKLTKEQIFEYYANNVDLGRRGSFSIRGFGEAAQAFFGKDIRNLNLQECATLAGMIQLPSFRNPIRWPERARQRRNVVLAMMRENGHIGDLDYSIAANSPLVLSRGGVESTDAPYFVDLVNEDLQDRFEGHDFQSKSYRVYTTLDLNLQQSAAEALRVALHDVDARLAKRFKKGEIIPEAQVALVAIDPRTGAVKALIGGRNYGLSQLNRAVAKRQPGSSFKPFVYAAAMNTAVAESGAASVFTPASTVMDEPTTFWYDDRPYEPANHKGEYHGVVTLRTALAKSLNIPTVKIAEAVGYDAVEDLAKEAGMNLSIKATPAIALGAYEVTPLEVAGAYTIFANGGVFVKPHFVQYLRDDRGSALYEHKVQKRNALDPRIAYIVTNMMEEVMRSGTGAGVRSRGFTLPAAGKTGTSHDGWFVGFTSNLICAVWVGFDDNRELRLEGAHSALPIWAEFMKRAHQFREYRNVRPFSPPEGIASVEVDPMSGQLATASCPSARTEVFVAGTQPIESCRLHGGGGTQIASWDISPPAAVPSKVPNVLTPPVSNKEPSHVRAPVRAENSQTPEAAAEEPKTEKKRGIFGRIRDIFK